MKQEFQDVLHLNNANKIRLKTINDIIEEYRLQGYRLTLRQLYYQLVSRAVIPNNDKEYMKIGNILAKGRLAGIVDWEAIVDRIRVPNLPYDVAGVDNAIDDTIEQYRLDRMADQDEYIEVWVEKDALSEVLKRVTHHYHIRLMVNKGYTSWTAMHDAYERVNNSGKDHSTILYIGDHDPSGLDMTRDIRERFAVFGVNDDVLGIIPVALTSTQIKTYNPPPNPTKHSDPRAGWYLEKFGETCWEVDALKPEVLHKELKSHIEALLSDKEAFNAVIEQEETDKAVLSDFKKQYDESKQE